MNKLEKLEAAVCAIFREQGINGDYTLTEIIHLLRGLNFNKLYSALCDRSQQVYVFCSMGMEGDSHRYYSCNMIAQDASLLWRSEPADFGSEEHSCCHFHELWLLADMSVVATSCFRAAEDEESLCSEYREIKGEKWPSSLKPINIVELWQYLLSLYNNEESDSEEESGYPFPVDVMYEP